MLDLGPVTWSGAVLVGGLLAADSVSWLQTMASRPVVAGTLGGALLGDPGAGFVAGAGLELLWLRHPPLGSARYPDAGPASLAVGAGYAAAGGGVVPLAVLLVAGWAMGWAGEASVRLTRAFNAWLLRDPAELASDPRRLEVRQRVAVAGDFTRGALLTAALLVPALLLGRAAAVEVGGAGAVAAASVAAAGIGFAAGAGGRCLPTRLRREAVLLAGAALALVAAVALR